MKIVQARADDAPGLLALTKVLGYETDELSLRARVKLITSRKDHCLLVAKDGDEIVGFCHGYLRLLIEVKQAIEIGGMAVSEKWQGKGVAKKLILQMEAWAKTQSLDQIVLSSNIMRVGAHGFYEHMGYKKIKQQFAFQKTFDS